MDNHRHGFEVDVNYTFNHSQGFRDAWAMFQLDITLLEVFGSSGPYSAALGEPDPGEVIQLLIGLRPMGDFCSSRALEPRSRTRDRPRSGRGRRFGISWLGVVGLVGQKWRTQKRTEEGNQSDLQTSNIQPRTGI